MNKIEAVLELMRQATREKNNVASYKRALRALKALEFNSEDAKPALIFLEYVRSDTREPFEWLTAKLAEKSQSK